MQKLHVAADKSFWVGARSLLEIICVCDTMAVYEMGHMKALFKTSYSGVGTSISVAGHYLQVLYCGWRD